MARDVRMQGTLLSGGADGVVMTWDLNDVIDSQGVIKMCARGHPKQKCGPDRFALEIPGFMDSISKCIRGLDSIPSMPDCFIAGTDQCDIWYALPVTFQLPAPPATLILLAGLA